jgi:hypothetical protein
MVDSALKGLFGGGDSDDSQRAAAGDNPLGGLFGGGGGGDDDPVADKEGARDFINRVTTGKPDEGFSTQEALSRLAQASKRATPEQMQRAAERATSRLDDNQRAEFGKMLQDRMGGQRSGSVGTTDGGGQSGDLSGMLGQLFGGGGGMGGLLGGLMGGDDGNNRATQGGSGGGLDDMLGGLLGSTAGKAAVGGLAAFVLSELLDGK